MTTTRRTVLQTAALATTMLATPFVRGAHAAGKLSVGFWDHWVPGANAPLRKALPGMGREGKGRAQGRLHHLERRQGSADRRRRGAGQDRPRHSELHRLVCAGLCREPRTGRRPHGGADRAARRGQRRRRISRQAGRPLGRGADLVRQHAVAALRPHRPDEAVRRARRDQDVPGRRAARQGAGGGLDLGFLLAGGREVPQGRLSVRHADQHHQRRGAVGRRDVQQPTARSWSTPRATSRSTATRRGPCWSGSRRPCRSSRRASSPGTTPRTTRR